MVAFPVNLQEPPPSTRTTSKFNARKPIGHRNGKFAVPNRFCSPERRLRSCEFQGTKAIKVANQ
jgi:hypothetical protein